MDTIEGGKWLPDQDLAWTLVTERGRAHPRARERARLLLRPQSRRHASTRRRSPARPSTARCTRATSPASRSSTAWPSRCGRAASTGSRSIARSSSIKTGDGDATRRRADDRHAHRRVRLRAGAGGAARHRRRADDVQVPHAVRRQDLRRHGDGAARRACRCATWRWCSSIPTGLLAGTAHAHDRHRARGRPARRGRLPARTAPASASCTSYDPRGERATRDIVSRAIVRRDARRARDAERRRLHRDGAPRARTNVRRQFKGMVERCADCGFDLAGGLVEVVPTAHYMMGGVVFGADCTHRARRVCSPPARTPAACTAPTASAATASPTPPCSAASPATRWPRGSRRDGELARARPRRRSTAAHGARACPLGQTRRRPRARCARRSTTCMWDDVGILRDAAGLARARSRARRARGRAARAPAWPTATSRYNLTWHDWLNLKSLIAVSRVIAPRRSRAKTRAARISARTFRRRAICPARPTRGAATRRRARDAARARALHARGAGPDDSGRGCHRHGLILMCNRGRSGVCGTRRIPFSKRSTPTGRSRAKLGRKKSEERQRPATGDRRCVLLRDLDSHLTNMALSGKPPDWPALARCGLPCRSAATRSPSIPIDRSRSSCRSAQAGMPTRPHGISQPLHRPRWASPSW